MADRIISIKIPDVKVTTALQGFLVLYPNVETVDGDTPKYTEAQWIVEKVRRNFVRDVRRGLQVLANRDAVVDSDDGVAEVVK